MNYPWITGWALTITTERHAFRGVPRVRGDERARHRRHVVCSSRRGGYNLAMTPPVQPPAEDSAMADEDWYKPHRPPASARHPQPGELLFEFVRGSDRTPMSCELRFHGQSY